MAGVLCGGVAIHLSEQCPGDPRFACGTTGGITGVVLWGAAMCLLVAGIAVGVRSWRRFALAAALIAAWIALARALPSDNDTLQVALAVAAALSLGGSLRLWGLAIIPLLVFAVVPLGGNSEDADGTSPWVYAVIDSVFLLLPFLVAGLAATGVHLYRQRSQRPSPVQPEP